MAVAACQHATGPADEGPPQQPDLATVLLTSLIGSDLVQHKLRRLYELADLKVRFVRLVKQFLQRESLLMTRRILDFVSRTCNFLIGFLPEPPPEEGFLRALFPVVGLNDPENPVHDNVQRVDREANFSGGERELFEKHKEDVIQVARLIYNTQ
ncbi:hypothetical protein BDFB_007998 [Asbolus verrucosus]|uniref:Uncharacterized protein n=1 Tax=Asbolus verrucosus TaxID=1661398 RepID=A0A482VUI8_ASBVE|nr:hypothetical protein BDFB_007998 [Asbolus verrucosus]